MFPCEEARERDRDKENAVPNGSVVLRIEVGGLEHSYAEGGLEDRPVDGTAAPYLRNCAIEFQHLPVRRISVRAGFVRDWKERALEIRMRPSDSGGNHCCTAQRKEVQRFTAGDVEFEMKTERTRAVDARKVDGNGERL